MLAKTICKFCKKEVLQDCLGCIKSKLLIHNCKFKKDGMPYFQENKKYIIFEK